MRTLAFLTERPGEVVTHEELREAIWGESHYVEAKRGIKTVIRELRGILDDDPQEPRFIETIRGEGYRFVAREQVRERRLVKVSKRRVQRRLRLALGLGALVVIGVISLSQVRALGQRPALLLHGFHAVEDTQELEAFTNLCSRHVVQSLVEGHGEEITVIHSNAESEDRAHSSRAVKYLVDGHVAAAEAGSSYYVTVELIDRADDRLVWLGSWLVGETDVPAWAESVTEEIVAALAESRPDTQSGASPIS